MRCYNTSQHSLYLYVLYTLARPLTSSSYVQLIVLFDIPYLVSVESTFHFSETTSCQSLSVTILVLLKDYLTNRFPLCIHHSLLSCCWSKGVEWPAKRCYVGLVTVGVQKLKTYLFQRRCYETVRLRMTFPTGSHYLTSRTVVLAIVFTV